jgi:hypothetical protein
MKEITEAVPELFSIGPDFSCGLQEKSNQLKCNQQINENKSISEFC